MKTLFSTTAVALLLAAPAFASPLVGNDSHDTNYSQGQSATGVGIGKGGDASSSATAGSYSGASAGAVNTTKQLNNQQLNSTNSAKQGQGQAQGQSADNNGNSYTSDDDNKTEVYAVSYTDAAPPTVAASIGDGVVVTTWGVKVLGPVFGMTDQHVHYLPSAIREIAEIDFMTQHNDGSYEGELVQLSYIHTVCAYMPELAVERKLDCK